MNPRIAWIQPEQFGPATELWQRLWEQSKECDDEETPLDGLQNVEMHKKAIKQASTTFTKEQFRQLKIEKEARLKKMQIPELSPLSREIQARSDNAACTTDFTYSELVKNHNQNAQWRTGRRYLNGVQGLHHEIIDFFNWIKARPEEYIMRYDVVKRNGSYKVESVIKHVFPNVTVEVFGSFQTGLYLPTSDIDMVVLNLEFNPANPNEHPLYRLQSALVEHGVAEALSIKVIDRAAVPIVKMRDMVTDVKVDISFNMKTGVESVSLIKEFIREFPALPYMVLLLKQFLLQRDMNEVWTGGISSYGLILMTVSFLQHQALEPQPKNLGKLLIDFFDLYGRKFNYANVTIRVKNGGSYIKKAEMQQQMEGRGIPSLLSIEDPLTPSNDIGRSSYGAQEVQAAFEYAYRILSRAICSQPQNPNESILSKLILVTESVTKYRNWIQENWRDRVPRLDPVPIPRPTRLDIGRHPRPGSIPMGSTMDSDESSDDEDRGDSISEDLSDNEDPEQSLDYLSPQGTSRSPVSTPRENNLSQDGVTQRRVEKTQTREWDEGKVDLWSNEPSRPERDSYDRDFPDLSRDAPKNTSGSERRRNRDRAPPAAQSYHKSQPSDVSDLSKPSEMSDKESIPGSDISISENGKKKAGKKPSVNLHGALFKGALKSLGAHDRINLEKTGDRRKSGEKRPTITPYTPKQRAATSGVKEPDRGSSRKSPREARSRRDRNRGDQDRRSNDYRLRSDYTRDHDTSREETGSYTGSHRLSRDSLDDDSFDGRSSSQQSARQSSKSKVANRENRNRARRDHSN